MLFKSSQPRCHRDRGDRAVHMVLLFLLSSKICCRCIDVELLLSVYLLCVLARHSAVSQKRSFGNGLTLLTLGMKIVTCFSSSWSRQLALSVGSRYHHRSRAQARSLLALSLCHHASCRRKRIRVLLSIGFTPACSLRVRLTVSYRLKYHPYTHTLAEVFALTAVCILIMPSPGIPNL